MATAYSGEVTVGLNTVRLKVDYSGTSASCTVQFRRTSSSYTGTFSDTSSTLTFNGTTKAAPYSYTGTVTTSTWVNLVTVSGYTVSVAGGTYNWSFYNSSGGVLGSSGTVTISSQVTTPTGLATTVTGRTWNSVTLKTSVTSFGTGVGPNRLVIHISPTSGDATYMRQDESSTSPFTATLNNSSSVGNHQAFTLKGCATVYPYIYASNGSTNTTTWGSAIYLPPAPPTVLSVNSQTGSETADSVTVKLNLQGDSSTNNNNVSVYFYYCYRYSTDGGSTWTQPQGTSWPPAAWVSAGTGKPWETKTPTFTVPYGAKVQVRFLQQYNVSGTPYNSEQRTLEFTAMSATSPSGLSVSGAAGDDFYPVVTGSITSYGRPNSVSNRVIALGVTTDSGGTRTIKRERAFYAQTSGTATLNNSDAYPGANPLTLKGCQRLYPYIWVNNQVTSPVETFGTSFYTRPATPASVTYAEGSLLTLTATDSADNESVSASYTFKIEDADGNVVYTGGVAGTTGAGNSGSVSIQPITTPGVYTIYAKIVYSGLSSGWASTSYTVVSPAKFYGPVSQATKQAAKLYGSVSSQSKAIKKLYGPVSGETKLVFVS